MDMQPEKVFKSGPLFISSKGLGWKSWKKRWFILTRTSLVFFRNDPSALPQRGGEVNLTLGGIDLNNSGSVVIREDKKLLTVLFPDGRDGRAFTLKAESSEELYEWKTALEDALAQAPSASLVMRHNGIFRGDTNYAAEGSFHQWRDKRTVKSLVVGQPIWLALEDIDGGPSFLEKALQFVEVYGTKVEGILRQSADVEEVERRVQEYEEGKIEFGYDEDAHIVGDCIKYVLREFPSSPVPASCCTALLEAYRGVDGKEARANAMRSVIFVTFPELNRRLLQRILKMMHTVSSHASDNLMTPWAVAACMAPLLLRPLVDGECQFEEDFDMGTDNSQLLAAANAANNAQAIITTLLEEYENVFDDDIANRCSISADSRTENSDSEDSADVRKFHIENKSCHEVHDSQSENSFRVSDLYDFKVFGCDDMDAESPRSNLTPVVNSDVLINPQQLRDYNTQFTKQLAKQEHESEISVNVMETTNSGESLNSVRSATYPGTTTPMFGLDSCSEMPVSKPTVSPLVAKRPTVWKRSNGRRGLSLESVDSSGEEELSIQRLEIMKNDLQQRIATEARGNAILLASLEKRKQALHERRLALKQDVARLQEQLQAERDLKAALEVGLSMSSEQFASSWGIDSKTKAELEEIALAEIDVAKLKQKVAELHNQLNLQRHSHVDACERHQHIQNHDSQRKFIQQDFNTNFAYCNHEKKQKTEESFLGSYWRGLKEQVLASASIGRQNARKQLFNLGLGESKSAKARNLFMDELCPVDSLSSRSSGASAALAELTTRLNFFKERRSQLMEQLHSLDLSFGTVSSQGFAFKPSSPPWN